MADLTPEEQRFFETGELQPGMKAADPPAPDNQPVDPLALQALANAPAPAPAAPAPAPVANAPAAEDPNAGHTVSEATEILRRSLAEAQQRVGALEQYVQSITQKPAEKPDEPGPDASTDPLGAMMHRLESLNKQVADLQANLQGQQTQQTQAQQFQAFQQQVRALTADFIKTAPDFQDAYVYVRNGRVADLRALGYNDQQINETLFREEATLADTSIRNARNPAETIYEMAKRHGYVPKAAAAAPATPDAKLQSIKAAQGASKNLPASPGVEDISVEGLKDASDADLNKLVLDPKVWAKIVGSDQYPL